MQDEICTNILLINWKEPSRKLDVSLSQFILEMLDVDETTKEGNAECVITILGEIGSLCRAKIVDRIQSQLL